MTPTQRESEAREPLDFALLKSGPVHLYWRASILDEDIGWFVEHGYAVATFDCARWSTERVMHEDLARGLRFPDYYGHNLDAFKDSLLSVCGAANARAVLRLEHFDVFARAHGAVAHALLDIVASASRTALLWGARLVALVQSEDAQLRLPSVGACSIRWNPREWLESSRSRGG